MRRSSTSSKAKVVGRYKCPNEGCEHTLPDTDVDESVDESKVLPTPHSDPNLPIHVEKSAALVDWLGVLVTPSNWVVKLMSWAKYFSRSCYLYDSVGT